MKKLLATISTFIIVMALYTTVYASEFQTVNITVAGESMHLENPAMLVDGHTLVPMHEFLVNLNPQIDVTFRNLEAEEGVYRAGMPVSFNGRPVVFHFAFMRDSAEFWDGVRMLTAPVATRYIDGTFYIPLSVVVEFMELSTGWDAETTTVDIREIPSHVTNNPTLQNQYEQYMRLNILTDYSTATIRQLTRAGYAQAEAIEIFERAIFDEINRVRADHGLTPVVWNQALANASRTHAEDMAINNMLSHTGSDGSTSSQRSQRHGGLDSVTEIAGTSGYTQTPQARVQSWMNSPAGHRRTVLSESREGVRVAGVGFAANENGSGRVAMKFGSLR